MPKATQPSRAASNNADRQNLSLHAKNRPPSTSTDSTATIDSSETITPTNTNINTFYQPSQQSLQNAPADSHPVTPQGQQAVKALQSRVMLPARPGLITQPATTTMPGHAQLWSSPAVTAPPQQPGPYTSGIFRPGPSHYGASHPGGLPPPTFPPTLPPTLLPTLPPLSSLDGYFRQTAPGSTNPQQAVRTLPRPSTSWVDGFLQTSPPHTYEPCSVCKDGIHGLEMITSQCGHRSCYACLARVFNAAVNGKRAFPPKCCDQILPLKLVRRRLSERTVKQYEEKMAEYKRYRPITCSNGECRFPIPFDRTYSDCASCEWCGHLTCCVCKMRRHQGPCVSDSQWDSVLRVATENGWQPCFHCNPLSGPTLRCNHGTSVKLNSVTFVPITNFCTSMYVRDSYDE